MPTFYLHLIGPDRTANDLDGKDFTNLAGARQEAIEGARCLMAEMLKFGQPLQFTTFKIADQTGRTVAEIPFREALPSGFP